MVTADHSTRLLVPLCPTLLQIAGYMYEYVGIPTSLDVWTLHTLSTMTIERSRRECACNFESSRGRDPRARPTSRGPTPPRRRDDSFDSSSISALSLLFRSHYSLLRALLNQGVAFNTHESSSKGLCTSNMIPAVSYGIFLLEICL